MSRSAPIFSAFAAMLFFGHPAFAAEAAGQPAVVQPNAFKWAPAPGLPTGAQIAVLYGDPSTAVPFGIRLKFPAGYEVPTHSHPTDEFITVLSGNGRMSFGEHAGAESAGPLPTGAFMSLPGGAWHHLWVDAEMVVELHSTGPFEVHVHAD